MDGARDGSARNRRSNGSASSGGPIVSYLSMTFNIAMYAQSACNTISHVLNMGDSRCNIYEHTRSHPLPQPSSSITAAAISL